MQAQFLGRQDPLEKETCQSLPQAELFVRQRERPGLHSQASQGQPKGKAEIPVVYGSPRPTPCKPWIPLPGLAWVKREVVVWRGS